MKGDPAARMVTKDLVREEVEARRDNRSWQLAPSTSEEKKTLSTHFFPCFLRLLSFFFSLFFHRFLSLFNFHLLHQWIKESNRPQACDEGKRFNFYLAQFWNNLSNRIRVKLVTLKSPTLFAREIETLFYNGLNAATAPLGVKLRLHAALSSKEILFRKEKTQNVWNPPSLALARRSSTATTLATAAPPESSAREEEPAFSPILRRDAAAIIPRVSSSIYPNEAY